MLEDRPRGEMLRVWAPGCARGEEAYAAAIALAAACEARSTPAEIKVFGADANEHAIKRARSGSYPIIIADEISDGRLTDFFQAFGGTCRVKREIREMCVFAQQDALQDPPFSHLNLIVCGGSLASLTAAAQRNLLDRFSYGLRPGGLLLLAEEMSTPDGERFVRVDERLPLYRKLTAEGSPGAGAASPPAARTAAESKASHESHVQREANRVLLDRYAPPGVIVDDHFHIVQFQGRIGRYLSPASGEASLNLLRMVGDGLIYGLKAAINDARTHGAAARREGLRVELDGEGPLVNIEVVPLEPTSERRHYLVLFEGPALAADAKGRPGAPQPAKRSSTARRQREMALNQEYLQSVIHDLEQANTELQAAIEEVLSSNEELQSSNEELDASQEELQSTNEELNTVNDELHSRNRELDQVNQDLMSLFSNLHIAVVMVSRNLRIRRFTPLAGKLLNLIPGDIGRPVSHIKPAFECPELAPLIADAVRQGKVEEFNVSNSSGKHYSLSLRPYSGRDGRIAGVLLTLVDN
ncbi:MAG TPA: CheR family methyltransferase [Pirellulales bacterium]|nr:CheR family methyltransferase [Pirellulales bacterium]